MDGCAHCAAGLSCEVADDKSNGGGALDFGVCVPIVHAACATCAALGWDAKVGRDDAVCSESDAILQTPDPAWRCVYNTTSRDLQHHHTASTQFY
jgi:hypothetical protein